MITVLSPTRIERHLCVILALMRDVYMYTHLIDHATQKFRNSVVLLV